MEFIEIINENSDSLLFPLTFSKSENYSASIENDHESYFFLGGAQEEEHIKDIVILEVSGYSSCLSNPDDIALRAENGTIFGVLCLSIEDKLFEVQSMTPARYVSFIMDSQKISDVQIHQSHTFTNSYLLVDKNHIEEYKNKYMKSSPIWGQFTHYPKTRHRFSSEIDIIDMKEGIVFPSSEYKSKVQDAIHSTDSFDRFLKKYHLLELIYDWLVVLKLRTMDESIKDFRSVMNSYSREEFPSLKAIINEYVQDPQALAQILYKADAYEDLAKKIFQEYSKESNPIKGPDKWNAFWSRLKNNNLNTPSGRDTPSNREKNNLEIKAVSAYWIYRIRCSCAHTKLGEYIFSAQDEEFVAEFGEMLIDAIIIQVYRDEQLKVLFNKSKQINTCLNSLPS